MPDTAISIRPTTIADQPAIRRCVEEAYSRDLTRMTVPPAPLTAGYGDLIRRHVVDVAVRLPIRPRPRWADCPSGPDPDGQIAVVPHMVQSAAMTRRVTRPT